MYYSDYDEGELQARALQLRADAARHRRVWVVFDNTAHGHAIANAARLQALLRHRPTSGFSAATAAG